METNLFWMKKTRRSKITLPSQIALRHVFWCRLLSRQVYYYYPYIWQSRPSAPAHISHFHRRMESKLHQHFGCTVIFRAFLYSRRILNHCFRRLRCPKSTANRYGWRIVVSAVLGKPHGNRHHTPNRYADSSIFHRIQCFHFSARSPCRWYTTCSEIHFGMTIKKFGACQKCGAARYSSRSNVKLFKLTWMAKRDDDVQ